MDFFFLVEPLFFLLLLFVLLHSFSAVLLLCPKNFLVQDFVLLSDFCLFVSSTFNFFARTLLLLLVCFAKFRAVLLFSSLKNAKSKLFALYLISSSFLFLFKGTSIWENLQVTGFPLSGSLFSSLIILGFFSSLHPGGCSRHHHPLLVDFATKAFHFSPYFPFLLN